MVSNGLKGLFDCLSHNEILYNLTTTNQLNSALKTLSHYYCTCSGRSTAGPSLDSSLSYPMPFVSSSFLRFCQHAYWWIICHKNTEMIESVGNTRQVRPTQPQIGAQINNWCQTEGQVEGTINLRLLRRTWTILAGRSDLRACTVIGIFIAVDWVTAGLCWCWNVFLFCWSSSCAFCSCILRLTLSGVEACFTSVFTLQIK